MHGEVELRIIILHRTQKLIHADFRRQLLANLALQRLLWRFPCLHLSARELPPVFEIAISSLSGEYLIFFDLRSSLLTLGRVDASITLLSLNRSLVLLIMFVCFYMPAMQRAYG